MARGGAGGGEPRTGACFHGGPGATSPGHASASVGRRTLGSSPGARQWLSLTVEEAVVAGVGGGRRERSWSWCCIHGASFGRAANARPFPRRTPRVFRVGSMGGPGATVSCTVSALLLPLWDLLSSRLVFGWCIAQFNPPASVLGSTSVSVIQSIRQCAVGGSES